MHAALPSQFEKIRQRQQEAPRLGNACEREPKARCIVRGSRFEPTVAQIARHSSPGFGFEAVFEDLLTAGSHGRPPGSSRAAETVISTQNGQRRVTARASVSE